MRNVSTEVSPRCEAQRLMPPLTCRVRHQLGRNADARAGRRIVDDAPADRVLLRLRGGRERGALRQIEHAGFLAAVALLERLDGRDRALAEFAADHAVVVAGPDQVVLDRDAIGERNGAVGVGDRLGDLRGLLGASAVVLGGFGLGSPSWSWRRPLWPSAALPWAPPAWRARRRPARRPRGTTEPRRASLMRQPRAMNGREPSGSEWRCNSRC